MVITPSSFQLAVYTPKLVMTMSPVTRSRAQLYEPMKMGVSMLCGTSKKGQRDLSTHERNTFLLARWLSEFWKTGLFQRQLRYSSEVGQWKRPAPLEVGKEAHTSSALLMLVETQLA